MRKFILRIPVLVILILLVSNNGFSLSIVKTSPPGSDVSPATIDYLRASVFVKLSVKEFQAMTGRRLNLPQKIYFKIIQRRLKHELKRNPDLLITQYYNEQKAKFKLDLLWFVVAAIIEPFGILLAYISPLRKGGPTKKNKITSAWLGFILFAIWFGILFLF